MTKILYLGNHADDIREFNDDDIIWLTTSAQSVGRVDWKEAKSAYLGVVWNGLVCEQKYFYYRDANVKNKGGEVCENKEAAKQASEKWVEENNKNTYDTIVKIKASQIDEDIAKKFYFIEQYTDYPEQVVPLDPRFLGMWLGDGTCGSTEVTTVDEPVKEYISNYAKQLSCRITISKKKVPGHCIIGTTESSNMVRTALKSLKVLNNKHIPELYMKNSKSVRLAVLGGLIDTDGTLEDNIYDITQKREVLVDNIVELARSLGIYARKTSRQSKATNSENPTYNTYYRAKLYMSKRTPDIELLLPRKKWHYTDNTNTCNIKISLSKTKERYKHTWTDELNENLKSSVLQHTNIFGQISWSDIAKLPLFSDMTTEGLRTQYALLVSKGEVAKPTNDALNDIKKHFVQICGLHQNKKGRIDWTTLMKDSMLKSLTVQQVRTLMSKLTEEEKAFINNTRISKCT